MGEAIVGEGFDLGDFAGGEGFVEVVVELGGFGDNGAPAEFGAWALLRVFVDVKFVVPLTGER